MPRRSCQHAGCYWNREDPDDKCDLIPEAFCSWDGPWDPAQLLTRCRTAHQGLGGREEHVPWVLSCRVTVHIWEPRP